MKKNTNKPDKNTECEEGCIEQNGCAQEVDSEDPGVATSAEDNAQSQIAELTDRLQRTMADFDNYRKRTIKERASMHADGVRDTIEKLLPVIDNFERALQSEKDKDGGFYKGVQMIFKQLKAVIADIGIEEIPDVGESFSPDVHFAVSHIDDASYGENEVIEVLQKGYRYNDKVIRPSMVRVAN